MNAWFRDANLIRIPVSVKVVEARGRAFQILGGVEKPGQYAATDSKFRLLDAIAMAGGVRGDLGSVLIVRQSGAGRPKGKENDPPATPRIEFTGKQLLTGDSDLNVFVRPHDTIVISAVLKSVELRVGKDGLHFQGNPVTWEQLAVALEKLPDRTGTILNISADSEDLTVGTFFTAQSRARELVLKYGLRELATTGVVAK
jgi:protein involved in polysaccharide export with SLBB domain